MNRNEDGGEDEENDDYGVKGGDNEDDDDGDVRHSGQVK